MKNDNPDALHSIIYIQEDGTFSIGDRCSTLPCAINSMNPISAEKVWGRAILDRVPGTETAYWARFGGSKIDRERGEFVPSVAADHESRVVMRMPHAERMFCRPASNEQMSNEQMLLYYATLAESGTYVPSWVSEELAYRLAAMMEQQP